MHLKAQGHIYVWLIYFPLGYGGISQEGKQTPAVLLTHPLILTPQHGAVTRQERERI